MRGRANSLAARQKGQSRSAWEPCDLSGLQLRAGRSLQGRGSSRRGRDIGPLLWRVRLLGQQRPRRCLGSDVPEPGGAFAGARRQARAMPRSSGLPRQAAPRMTPGERPILLAGMSEWIGDLNHEAARWISRTVGGFIQDVSTDLVGVPSVRPGLQHGKRSVRRVPTHQGGGRAGRLLRPCCFLVGPWRRNLLVPRLD